MKKLYQLKNWLTIEDTARHLSIVLGETVSEADVLRLALDGHLKLSVNFVNHAVGIAGKIVPIDEVSYKEVPSINGKGTIRLYGGVTIYTNGLATHVIIQDKMLVGLDGVYDLPMIGGERLDVEHKYQMLTNGVEVTLVNIDSAFIEAKNGEIVQLQTSNEDNEYCDGSNARLEKIKKNIIANNIGVVEAEMMLSQHKQDRIKFLENKFKSATESHFPSDGLPDDSVMVVRTSALREFEEAINGTTENPERPITTRERNTLLVIIAALAKEAKIDLSKPSKAGESIAHLTEILGAPVDHSTIEQKIRQINDAVQSRAK